LGRFVSKRKEKERAKKECHLASRILLLALIILVFSFARLGYSQQVSFGVDYLFEKYRQPEVGSEIRFTQIYDIMLEKSVRPLYDLKFKFQFRSESGSEEQKRNGISQNRNRLQNLPSLSLHLGNPVVGLDSGFSKDNIREKDLNYDLARGYSTLIWKPFYLPKFTVQYQDEKRDMSTQEDNGDEKKLIMRDDYRLALGIFVLSHSYAVEKREVSKNNNLDIQNYDNHDLNNKGQINYQFSGLDSRVQLNSDYELSHHDKKDEEANNIYRSLEQRANFRFHGLPSQNTAVHYNLFLGEIQKWTEHDRQRSVENNLKTELLPYKYLKTTLEVSHDNHWETSGRAGYGSDIRNSVLTYGLRLEPKIPGLIMSGAGDPNNSGAMPPLKTSLTLSSSLNRENGNLQYRTNSALLKGSTEVYRGVEVRTDLEIDNTRDFYDQDEKWEEDIKVDTSFDLRDDLKYFFRNENKWTKYNQEVTIRTFDGNIWHLITYRPADQLFLTIDNKLEYGDIDNVTYSYRIGWVPAPKLRIEARYQYAEAADDKYFSSEMNINITKTLKFRLKYTYPSDDQVISFRFTLKT